MSLQQEIKDILEKFKKQEDNVDDLYKETVNKLDKTSLLNDDKCSRKKAKFPSSTEAELRNKQILQDLEIIKGNLRSKAIFSPIEIQWEQICKNYEQQPALPVTTWKCNNTVFV